MLYSELSGAAQTAYAQLVEATLVADHRRSVADLPGSFAAKTVKGSRYWYFQFTEPSGTLRQVFIGPDNDAVHNLMARKRTAAAGDTLGPLAQSAIALGCGAVTPRHFRVIRRLAEYGFFRAGGVLIGTHAFLCYANLLGVRWETSDTTQDIDFAHAGKNISVALPANIEAHTHSAIESLEMGFLPVTGLGGKTGGAYLIPKEPEFRLDFLTTLHRGKETPYEHPQLHVTLQPIKFMEYSLEQIQHAALVSGDGAILVNVPHPARYALHKLLVYGEREGGFVAKSGKDLRQSAALLTWYKNARPWEVEAHWRDLTGRGKGWASRATRGLNALDKAYPELEAKAWLEIRKAAPAKPARRKRTPRR